MSNAFVVCGNPENIMEKIELFENIGINEFVVGSPIGKDRLNSLRLLEDVLASF